MDKFHDLAKKKGCTAGQLVLAWLVAQGDNMFVIPGTKKIKYLEENIGGAHVTLTSEEEKEVRGVVSEASVVGDRTPMGGSYVDTVPLTA